MTPNAVKLKIRTERQVPKLGVMLVGWGGNNGTTVTAAVLANRLGLSWPTRTGRQSANYFGSLLMASTVSLGVDADDGRDVYAPFHQLLPMVHPNDIVLDGWDISSLDLAAATERARVLEPALQDQLRPYLEKLRPRPSIYCPHFIAANQEERADNVLAGPRSHQLQRLRADIRDFRAQHALDKVIVLWTANTERFAEIQTGLNDTADNLMTAIDQDADEVSPSTLFAVASILEGVSAFLSIPSIYQTDLGWPIRSPASDDYFQFLLQALVVNFRRLTGWLSSYLTPVVSIFHDSVVLFCFVFLARANCKFANSPYTFLYCYPSREYSSP